MKVNTNLSFHIFLPLNQPRKGSNPTLAPPSGHQGSKCPPRARDRCAPAEPQARCKLAFHSWWKSSDQEPWDALRSRSLPALCGLFRSWRRPGSPVWGLCKLYCECVSTLGWAAPQLHSKAYWMRPLGWISWSGYTECNPRCTPAQSRDALCPRKSCRCPSRKGIRYMQAVARCQSGLLRMGSLRRAPGFRIGVLRFSLGGIAALPSRWWCGPRVSSGPRSPSEVPLEHRLCSLLSCW